MMSITSQLNSLVGWPNRSTIAIDREIDEELDFHIECHTQELIASGLSPEAAADEAERQFGSRDRIRRECQAVDYGNQTRWLMALCALSVLSIATIGWMGHLLRQAHFQNQQMKMLLGTQLPATTAEANEELHPLDGVITDKAGKPVSGAKVLLLFKSWPNNRYRQRSLEQTSDKDGKFQFPDLYSTTMKTGFLVTVLADGQTMKSEYLVNHKKLILKPFRFKLEPAIEKTFVFTRKNGEPIANAVVFPDERHPKGSREPSIIYHQSGESAGFRTDAEGRVKLSLFQVGDVVNLTAIDSGEPVEFPATIDETPEQKVSPKSKEK